MNFISEFVKGQKGGNKGLPLGPGLKNIHKAIGGIHRGRIYGIGAAPKVGKTTLVDYAFLIQPFIHCIENNIPIEWIYFSFEIDRVSKEFDIAAYFLNHDFNIDFIKLDENVKKDGENFIPLSPDYLRGRILDDNNNVIKVNEDIKEKLKKVYEDRIVPIFGEYNEKGVKIKNGYVTFIEEKSNPTGIRNFLLNFASARGQFLYEKFDGRNRIIGYIPKVKNKYTIIITDHIRRILPERNFQMKQTIDKFLEYNIEIKNWCGYTFVNIIHLNRNLSDVHRLKEFGDLIYPTDSDIKDSGNISEDSDYLFTMMNPNDGQYNLNSHFGLKIKDSKGNEIYPNMRTVHLVQSRHCEFPQHFRVEMLGNIKNFKLIKI